MLIQALSRVTLTSLNISRSSYTFLHTFIKCRLSRYSRNSGCTKRLFLLTRARKIFVQSSCERYWIVYWIAYLLMLWYACSAKYIQRISTKLFEEENVYLYIFLKPIHTSKRVHISEIYVQKIRKIVLFSMVMVLKRVNRICPFSHIAESDSFYRFYNVSRSVHYSVHYSYVHFETCKVCRGYRCHVSWGTRYLTHC